MARSSATVWARVPAERVFDFVADLRHAPLWDPQALAVEMVTPGPVGLGTRFLLTGALLGRRLELPYEIVGFARPGRLVLAGETRLLRYRDEITVTGEPGGARLVYEAEIELRPAPRLFELPLRLVFQRVAATATRGMARAIEEHA